MIGKFLELSTLREPTHVRSFSLRMQKPSNQITKEIANHAVNRMLMTQATDENNDKELKIATQTNNAME